MKNENEFFLKTNQNRMYPPPPRVLPFPDDRYIYHGHRLLHRELKSSFIELENSLIQLNSPLIGIES